MRNGEKEKQVRSKRGGEKRKEEREKERERERGDGMQVPTMWKRSIITITRTLRTIPSSLGWLKPRRRKV
jgi:hypothetical protein